MIGTPFFAGVDRSRRAEATSGLMCTANDRHLYEIEISVVAVKAGRSQATIRKSVELTLRRERIRRARISLVLVSDRHIAHLNRAFRNHRGPTDVLAFDLGDELSPAPKKDGGRNKGRRKRPVIDGEIVMSVETATRAARMRRHSVSSELALYAIHGVLHLLGYRDHDRASAALMHAIEDEVLQAVGLGAVYHTPAR